MDDHVDSVPGGLCEAFVEGMDFGNVDAWKFFGDASGDANDEVVGVSERRTPVLPVRAHETVGGVLTGRVFRDDDLDRRQARREQEIPGVMVTAVEACAIIRRGARE